MSKEPAIPKFKLTPDCGEKIREVALCIISRYFSAENRSKLVPIANLLQSFDADTKVRLLVDTLSEASARRFLIECQPRCEVEIVPTAPGWAEDRPRNCLRDIFIQDKLSMATELLSGKDVMLRSSSSIHFGALYGDWLDRTHQYDKFDYHYWPDGGDCLVGDSFWIVNTAIYLDKRIERMDLYDGLLRSMDQRMLHYHGFTKIRLDSQATPPVGKVLRPVSDLYHLDLILAVTGCRAAERPEKDILMLARPLDAGEQAVKDAIPRNWLDDHAWEYSSFWLAGAAHEMKRELENENFSVLPTPMPAIGNRWYTYNNVLVENSPRPRVWLPQFGDEEEWLMKYDDAAVTAWQSLGFEVKRIYGWSALLKEGGAVRCAAKVLRRS